MISIFEQEYEMYIKKPQQKIESDRIFMIICGIMFIPTIIFIPLFILIYSINKKDKETLKYRQQIYEEFSSYIIEHQQNELVQIARNEIQERRFDEDDRIMAAAALIDISAEKALMTILDIIKEEIKDRNINTQFLSLLKYYSLEEDQNIIYDYLFESILAIQEKFFTPVMYHQTFSTQVYMSTKDNAGIALTNIGNSLGFNDRDAFIRFNIIVALQKSFRIYKDEKSFDLEKLAELCRTTEDETLTVLRDILEIAPQLGEYKEFEMIFVPSTEINKFDSFIDIVKIKKELQAKKESEKLI